MKYEVRKDVRFAWTVEAEDADGALAAASDLEPGSIEVLRQRVKNLEKRTPVSSVITDRALSPGRKFVARYRGQEHRATVQEDGSIKVEGIDKPFRSLSTAGAAITGHATNGWAFFRDAPAEEPAAKPKKGKAARKAAEPAPEPEEPVAEAEPSAEEQA
jgi:hypothetical protein